MKYLVGVDKGAYSFDPASKTITFSGLGDLTLENILLITNVTDHIILYNFADALLGGTVAGNVLTLAYDTVGMSASDRLQIYVDLPESYLMNLILSVKTLLQKLADPGYVDKSANQVRAQITGSLTTVTTLTNLTNFGTQGADVIHRMTSINMWSNSVRRTIS